MPLSITMLTAAQDRSVVDHQAPQPGGRWFDSNSFTSSSQSCVKWRVPALYVGAGRCEVMVTVLRPVRQGLKPAEIRRCVCEDRKSETRSLVGRDTSRAVRKRGADFMAGWSSLVARRPHKPKVAGSNPAHRIQFYPSVAQWIE